MLQLLASHQFLGLRGLQIPSMVGVESSNMMLLSHPCQGLHVLRGPDGNACVLSNPRNVHTNLLGARQHTPEKLIHHGCSVAMILALLKIGDGREAALVCLHSTMRLASGNCVSHGSFALFLLVKCWFLPLSVAATINTLFSEFFSGKQDVML